MVILRKLVTNDWVHVPPELVSRDGRRLGDCWHCMSIFGGISVGMFKYEKTCDHRNKKLLINRCVKALITLKEGNQDLLKLHVSLRGFSTVEEKMGLQKGNFVWSRKITCIVCIGVSTPLSKAPPTLLRQAPLNLQTVQAMLPYILVFHDPPKDRIFQWIPKYWNYLSLTWSHLLKSKFLVITEKNIFVYELFLTINISDFSLLFYVETAPTTPPSLKMSPTLLKQFSLKTEILSSPPFLEIWSEAHNPPPPLALPHSLQSLKKGGDAHYDMWEGNSVYLLEGAWSFLMKKETVEYIWCIYMMDAWLDFATNAS